MAKEKKYCGRCGRRIKSGKYCVNSSILISKEKTNKPIEEIIQYD